MEINATLSHKETIKNYFRSTFEKDLLEEISDCPLLELEEQVELRHEAQSLVRYTPLVMSGSIRVTRVDDSGKEILMYFIQPNESCFLSITASLNNNYSNVENLRAVIYEPTTMVSINDEQIRRWNNDYRTWREFTAKIYNRRFGEFFSIIDNVVFRSVDEKLIEKLNELKDENDVVHMTHQELAYRIGTAREVVSRLLKTLEKDGKVKLSRGKINILTLL